MSAFYISIGLLFGAWVWFELGAQSGEEYLTGFLVEKTLAMDNVFVISLIFTYFAVPLKYQHRVLFWGILGVIVLRAIMIGAGATLVAAISLAALCVRGVPDCDRHQDAGDGRSRMPDIENNPVLRSDAPHDAHHAGACIRKRFSSTKADPATGKMVRYATPLFVALVLVEVVDLIFAVDSIPAIFAITTDPYIVYTSNIFAILGLARIVLRARRRHRPVHLSEAGAGTGADLHRLENFHCRPDGLGEVSSQRIARRDSRPDRGRHHLLADADPRATRLELQLRTNPRALAAGSPQGESPAQTKSANKKRQDPRGSCLQVLGISKSSDESAYLLIVGVK